MRLSHLSQDSQEPIGIVIADGGRPELAPRFSAFVWGPVPDDAETRQSGSMRGVVRTAARAEVRQLLARL